MKASQATKLVLPLLLATATLIGQGTSAAGAQEAALTYVSSTGTDTNACTSPSTACRFFPAALSKTADGGAIACVNTGYYGIVTINKSVTIDCPAGGGANNAQFIIINAPDKNVKLRNLALNATGASVVIIIDAAGSVHLENVVVTGSPATGILDRRTGPGKLFISESSIVGNSGPGIVVAPQAGTVIGAALNNIIVRDNTYGIAVGNGGRVTIKRSVFSGNVTAGIEADPGAFIEVEETLMSFNGTGVLANNGATVSIANSGIASNNTAVSGTTFSFGNNRIIGNSSDGTAPTPIGFR